MRPHAFLIIECSIPENLTIDEYRRGRGRHDMTDFEDLRELGKAIRKAQQQGRETLRLVREIQCTDEHRALSQDDVAEVLATWLEIRSVLGGDR